MDDGQEQDHYEQRLRDVFNSFDASGCGSLCSGELSGLCQSLQLHDAIPALLHTLFQSKDLLTARVDFENFKNALILVLSATFEPAPAEQDITTEPDSPEIQPKFVKGSKRYGRRSTPEFMQPISDFSVVDNAASVNDQVAEGDSDDSAVPRKRERWNAHESSTEEFEAHGQMHLWNPDELGTPRGPVPPLPLEEQLHVVCNELGLPWDGSVSHTDLLAVCERLGLDVKEDLLQTLGADGATTAEEFVSRVVNHNKPLTLYASTPYRQLKRHHFTQGFDEAGRRTAASSSMTSTIGLHLFSSLDDGSGHAAAEYILDAWMEEGLENGIEILQALNFGVDGKLGLGDLTMALENELLVTKNGIHQAALASFKSEIRYLLERVDRELREKDKIRSDLEKAEKLKSQLAAEVDEHHSAIEHRNNLNLRKLEQDHKDKLAAVKCELMNEMEQIQHQASLQQEELEAEIAKIREDESFLRDHLSISVKESRRLEMELLDSSEKLMEAESQTTKLQKTLDSVMKEKFGDLDPGSAEFFLQEERIKQLRSSYETQCRELQDRIDELQSELQDLRNLGRAHLPYSKSLSEELDSKSPGMESDPGLGSEEAQPFVSLEAEMMLERLKEQHLQEVMELRSQLDSKINELHEMATKEWMADQQKAATSAHSQEQEEMARPQGCMQDLQIQLQQAERQLELERKQAEEREELQNHHEEEVGTLRQRLLEAHTNATDLEDQLDALQAEMDANLAAEVEELKKRHAIEIKALGEQHAILLEAKLVEERETFQEKVDELDKMWSDEIDREKEHLRQNHEDELRFRLDEATLTFEEQRDELVRTLTEQWQEERAGLCEQNKKAVRMLLDEEMQRLISEQNERERAIREEWQEERAQLMQQQEEALHTRMEQERRQLQTELERQEQKLRDECEEMRLQLVEDYEELLQERLDEERKKLGAEKDEVERRLERSIEDRARLEANQREAVQELTAKHTEERDSLSNMLNKLREDFIQEGREIELNFTQRIEEVEKRFSGDQQSAAERFQADIFKLERHYQNEVTALNKSHIKQKLHWEEELGKAVKDAEEQRRLIQEAESLKQEQIRARHEPESKDVGDVELLLMKNQQLQNELDRTVSLAQIREIELCRQLNDLHNWLRESLEGKEELLTQSEKVAEMESQLSQAVEGFQQERADFLSSQTALLAKHNEVLSIMERQTEERIKLLNERDDLKMTIEELELSLKRASLNSELDRRDFCQNVSILEGKLKDKLVFCGSQVNGGVECRGERDHLAVRLKWLEAALGNHLDPTEKPESKLTEGPDDVNGQTGRETVNHADCPNISRCKQEAVCLFPKPSFEPPLSLDDVGFLTDTPKSVTCSVTEVALGFADATQQDHLTPLQPELMQIKSGDARSNECTLTEFITSFENGYGGLETDYMYSVVTDEHLFGESSIEGADSHTGTCPADMTFSHGGSCCPTKSTAHNNRRPQAPRQDEPHCAWAVRRGRPGGERTNAMECEEEGKPQDVPDLLLESSSHEQEQGHETAFDHSELEGRRNSVTSLGNTEKYCLPKQSEKETQAILSDGPDLSLIVKHCQQPEDHQRTSENQADALGNWQVKCSSTAEENMLLHERVSLLQQKMNILERPLAHNSETIKNGQQILEENYCLKVRVLFLVDCVMEAELMSFKMSQLQIRYEDCMSENEKLRVQSRAPEERVWELGNGVYILHHFADVMGESRPKWVSEKEGWCEPLSAMHVDKVQEFIQEFEHLSKKLEAMTEPEVCATELEEQSSKLQDECQTLREMTQAHRSEASCLADENVILRHKIAELRDEDRKEAQDDILEKEEQSRTEKAAAQWAVENFKKQVSEQRLHSQLLEEENRMLLEQNTQLSIDTEKLRQHLAELLRENKWRESIPAEETHKVEVCVSALEAELTKAQEDVAHLERKNGQLTEQLSSLKDKVAQVDSLESQLSQLLEEKKSISKETRGLRNQLSKAQEKVKTMDQTLQAVGHHGSRLQVWQQEKVYLKHEIALLHKRLQNANDTNRVLEKSLHSNGVKNPSKKLYREEISQLLEQDQLLLKQENERLQAEMCSTRGDLVQSREKVWQLEATVQSLKQQCQSSLVKAMEQENACLKQQLEAHRQMSRGWENGEESTELESLRLENESLKAQMARLSTQLLEAFQGQFVERLPPSPHRMPRGQQRAEVPDNMQDAREKKMRNMEGRMKEIELSLHDVKLLLREKVAQLKDQLHKNGKAEVLINDLYMENGQLLKALEITGQRQKIAEKKNYLLEEKINSLNKVVCDLNPSVVQLSPYHFKCS